MQSSAHCFVPRNDKVLLVLVFLYHLHRVFHIIKRNVGHNAMTQIENVAVLAFHAVEQAVNAFSYYFLSAYKICGSKLPCTAYALRQTLFHIQQVNIPVDRNNIRLSSLPLAAQKPNCLYRTILPGYPYAVQFTDDLGNITMRKLFVIIPRQSLCPAVEYLHSVYAGCYLHVQIIGSNVSYF